MCPQILKFIQRTNLDLISRIKNKNAIPTLQSYPCQKYKLQIENSTKK